MRIIQIDRQRGWSGQAQQVFLTARSLHERGHKVLVVCRPASKTGEYAIEEGIEVLYLPIKGGVSGGGFDNDGEAVVGGAYTTRLSFTYIYINH